MVVFFDDFFELCPGNSLLALEFRALRINVDFLSTFIASQFSFFQRCVSTSYISYMREKLEAFIYNGGLAPATDLLYLFINPDDL